MTLMTIVSRTCTIWEPITYGSITITNAEELLPSSPMFFWFTKKNYLLNSIRNIELIISKDNFHFDMMSSIEVDVEFVYWRDDV